MAMKKGLDRSPIRGLLSARREQLRLQANCVFSWGVKLAEGRLRTEERLWLRDKQEAARLFGGC